MEERICETDDFLVWSKTLREWRMVTAKMRTMMRWCVQNIIKIKHKSSQVKSIVSTAE